MRVNPNFNKKEFVYVDGQINYPGLYAIESKDERISDLLKRAGGLNEFAYPSGATLIRKTEYFIKETEVDKQLKILLALKDNLTSKTGSLSESDFELLKRTNIDLDKLYAISQKKKRPSTKQLILLSLQKMILYNRIYYQKKGGFNTTESIAIDLTEIINNKILNSNLLIQSGDTLFIPKKLETVRLRGELLNPTTVRHQENKTLKYYINNAGGFERRADKRKTFVIYPNGQIRATKKFLFFNNYPKVLAGSEIIVPKKETKNSSLNVATLTTVVTGLATLVLAITTINK